MDNEYEDVHRMAVALEGLLEHAKQSAEPALGRRMLEAEKRIAVIGEIQSRHEATLLLLDKHHVEIETTLGEFENRLGQAYLDFARITRPKEEPAPKPKKKAVRRKR